MCTYITQKHFFTTFWFCNVVRGSFYNVYVCINESIMITQDLETNFNNLLYPLFINLFNCTMPITNWTTPLRRHCKYLFDTLRHFSGIIITLEYKAPKFFVYATESHGILVHQISNKIHLKQYKIYNIQPNLKNLYNLNSLVTLRAVSHKQTVSLMPLLCLVCNSILTI